MDIVKSRPNILQKQGRSLRNKSKTNLSPYRVWDVDLCYTFPSKKYTSPAKNPGTIEHHPPKTNITAETPLWKEKKLYK